jgi:hypothetical protein
MVHSLEVVVLAVCLEHLEKMGLLVQAVRMVVREVRERLVQVVLTAHSLEVAEVVAQVEQAG